MKIKEHQYSFVKLDAFQQFYVIKRLGPILGTVFKLFNSMKDSKDAKGNYDSQKIFDIIDPLGEALSKLSDEDSKFVIITLLKGCSRVSSLGTFPAIVNDSMMVQDIAASLPTMIQLAWGSLMVNMGDFMDMLPQNLPDGSQNQSKKSNG